MPNADALHIQSPTTLLGSCVLLPSSSVYWPSTFTQIKQYFRVERDLQVWGWKVMQGLELAAGEAEERGLGEGQRCA